MKFSFKLTNDFRFFPITNNFNNNLSHLIALIRHLPYVWSTCCFSIYFSANFELLFNIFSTDVVPSEIETIIRSENQRSLIRRSTARARERKSTTKIKLKTFELEKVQRIVCLFYSSAHNFLRSRFERPIVLEMHLTIFTSTVDLPVDLMLN